MDVLLRLKYTKNDKKEFIHLCKEQYENNTCQLDILKEFRQSYSPDNALRWYTRECFFYKMINQALRIQDVHTIYLFRSYIRDIHRQLQKNQCDSPIQVYRSQRMSKEELKSLKNSSGHFIAVNSFFSTSHKRKNALQFLKSSANANNLKPVLFEITADPDVVTTKPFANISSHSWYADESEVLFMLGSIFRLTGVHLDDHGISIIQMVLCGDDDHDLQEVLEHMRNEYRDEEVNLYSLGTILWRMGESSLAEKYYMRLISEVSPDDSVLKNVYDSLSIIASTNRDLDASIKWKQKSLAITNLQPKKDNGTTFLKRDFIIIPTVSECKTQWIHSMRE
jgi:arsenate reductase-like glutaredoxin family protein